MTKTLYKLFVIMGILLMPMSVSASMTATEVLAKAAQKINNAKSVTVKFSGSASGTMTVCGQMFSMVAGGFGVWYNGTDMWTYSKRAGETTLTEPTPSELLESNPIEIIKSSQSKYTATRVSEAGKKYTLKLTPKGKGDNIKSATIVINTQTWWPDSIDIIFDSDQRMTVNIISITEGNTLPTATFAYPSASYPGVEIVDLR